ncbi:hypothetical protein [Brevibacterium spongiae]|uniref:Pyrimidine reductase, riboflavin biosynthesis n=1 Tax=Brevibacterium spongiae TaxID=2909672 RepID=A0ABY5SNE0_9MICO|nr:hypothetical protein [Brevibacterium spongiae]UVI34584.1 hypothetical protein L1F31_10595 [Brevibacterium spongiae]
MRRLIISLVQSINGSFAQDNWSTGVSTEADFRNFIALRRRASALIIDRRTALNPQLPVINAPGKALEHTPVHVLTESDPDLLARQLGDIGVDYRARQFTRDTLAEVVASLATRADTDAGEDLIVCESGPNLAFRLLEHYPGAELLLSISPRYIHTAGSHFSGLQADIELRLIEVRTEDDQVFLRYRRA